MKVTVKDIVDAKESFAALITKNIPFRANYRISKFINEINRELEAFEKIKGELFQKYGEKIEVDGQEMLEIKKDKFNIFNADMDDILSEEVILSYEPMYIEDLVCIKEGKEEEDSIDVKSMIELNKFFKSKEDDKVIEESKAVSSDLPK
jgi:hypothetical protein